MDSKEIISDATQATCHLSDSAKPSGGLVPSDRNPINGQSGGKAPRPMDIDIQVNFKNGQSSLTDNNGARSKTRCVSNGLTVNTSTKKSDIAADENQNPSTENCNLSRNKTKDLLSRKSSHDELYQNKKTSVSLPKQKSRHPFVKSSSLDGATNDPSPQRKEWFYVCFICNIPVSSAKGLQVHINKDHFDCQPSGGEAFSRAPREQYSQAEKLHTCFICNKHLSSTEELQLHINRDHFDSPVKPVSSAISDLASFRPPDCGEILLGDDSAAANSSEVVASLSEYRYLAEDMEAEQNDRLIAEMLQKQYEQEEKEFKKLQDMYGMTEKGNYKKQFNSNLSLAVQRGQISPFEYHMYKSQMSESQVTGVDDGVSCTKGVISSLRKFYQQQSKSKDVWLCSDLDHYSGSFGDTGWGCGYRNLQMMLSALAKESKYQSYLYGDYKVKNGRVASIKKLQQLIEHAWQLGFDRQGAEQLGCKLVDTKKWIGATEIVALLSSLKLKCRMVDVRSPSGQQQTHPKMFQWIRDYFKRKDRHEFRSPLYLQHQGHSRTVIGVEESHQNGNLTLLVFDPACTKAHMDKLKERPTAVLAQPLRKYLSSMTKDQYQIVAVVGIHTESEWNASKILKSEKLT